MPPAERRSALAKCGPAPGLHRLYTQAMLSVTRIRHARADTRRCCLGNLSSRPVGEGNVATANWTRKTAAAATGTGLTRHHLLQLPLTLSKLLFSEPPGVSVQRPIVHREVGALVLALVTGACTGVGMALALVVSAQGRVHTVSISRRSCKASPCTRPAPRCRWTRVRWAPQNPSVWRAAARAGLSTPPSKLPPKTRHHPW